MTDIIVDVEADGPAPGLYSMVCFGAVVCDGVFDKTFYGQTAPITSIHIPEALAVSGFTREQHEAFDQPMMTMVKFNRWLKEFPDRVTMWSDNPAFDWMFINYYLWRYPGENPMGWSARRIGDVYCGHMGNLRARWKNKLRKTVHDHNPVNDAKGNAEALWAIKNMLRNK
jgi:hypothetical protein